MTRHLKPGGCWKNTPNNGNSGCFAFQKGHDVSRAVDDDPHTGWAINTYGKGDLHHWANFTLIDAITIDDASHIQVQLSCYGGKRP